ncbi:MAG TPA: type II secretion system protein GspL [Parvularculaceae bacterium]|nr:type II secretion system protein GspL [Parvularculaceae bacterium]
MGERFLLLLGAAPDAPLRWGRFADERLIEGGWLESARDLGALAEFAENAEFVVALLPGEDVASRRMAASPRGTAKARAAAQYLMEDELGEPAELLHIVAARGLAIAVRREIIESWRDAFTAADFECEILSADYLALAVFGEDAAVIAESGRIVAAFGGSGLAIEFGAFERLAPSLFASAPPNVRLIGGPDAERLLPSEGVIERLGEAGDARVLGLYGEAIAKAPPANLFQGAFERRRAINLALGPWRRAGALAAAAALLFVASVVAEGVRAEITADMWIKAAHDTHARRFPEAASADPVAHARQVLARQSDGAFLVLASRFSDALRGNDGVQIDRIRFNASRNEFIVAIRSRTDSGIDDFKSALAKHGVATKDNGYRRAGASWSGELSARLQ